MIWVKNRIGKGKERRRRNEQILYGIVMVSRFLFLFCCHYGNVQRQSVQQAQPLLLGQYVLEALGSFTAALSVEVIIGLIDPGAGDTDPCSAQLLCQFD